MTKISDIENNTNYKRVLCKGFVGLVDHMGTDSSIVQAARVSYGNGTKTSREDRGLIRYLMKHKHTSPFEMCVVKLHLKLPLFVMRQLVRHRTSSLNEISARYSILEDEFYVPDISVISRQSKDNKQGRGDVLEIQDANIVLNLIETNNKNTYNLYSDLISNEQYSIARELARTVLPVNIYTELYWQQNLHNMLHLLKLRIDTHAQYEIRQYAEAIYRILKELYPITIEAWEDYILNSVTFSHKEIILIRALINNEISLTDTDELIFEKFGINKRELIEFKSNLDL